MADGPAQGLSLRGDVSALPHLKLSKLRRCSKYCTKSRWPACAHRMLMAKFSWFSGDENLSSTAEAALEAASSIWLNQKGRAIPMMSMVVTGGLCGGSGGRYLRTLALAFCVRCDGGGGSRLDGCRAKRLIPGCLGGHICGGGSVRDRAHRHRQAADVVTLRHADVVRSRNGGSTTHGSPGHPVQLGILDVQGNLGARTELPYRGRRRAVGAVSGGRRRSICDQRSPSPLSRGASRP